MEINPFPASQTDQAFEEGSHEVRHEGVASINYQRNVEEAIELQEDQSQLQDEQRQVNKMHELHDMFDEHQGDEAQHFPIHHGDQHQDEAAEKDQDGYHEQEAQAQEEGEYIEGDQDQDQKQNHYEELEEPVNINVEVDNAANQEKVTEQGQEQRYAQHEGVGPVDGIDEQQEQPPAAQQVFNNSRDHNLEGIEQGDMQDGLERQENEEEQVNPAQNVRSRSDQYDETEEPNLQPTQIAEPEREIETVLLDRPPAELPRTVRDVEQNMKPAQENNHHQPPMVVQTHKAERQQQMKEVGLSETAERRTVQQLHRVPAEKFEPKSTKSQVVVPASIVTSVAQQKSSRTSVVVPTVVVNTVVVEHFAPVIEAPQQPQLQQEFQILIPVPLFLSATQLHSMISSAYYERKEINTRYFTRFVHNRNHYYLKHEAVLDDITECILARMKRTAEYLIETASYFSQTTQAYRNFQQESGKVSDLSYLAKTTDMNTKNKYQWSSHVAEGMKKVLLNQNGLVSRMRAQEYYLSTTCLQSLTKIAKTHEQLYRKNGKQAMEFKGKFCNFEEQIIGQVREIQSRIAKEKKQQKKGEQATKYDLMELELRLLQNMQKSRILLEDWGKAQLEWWSRSIKQERATVESLKQVFRGYLHSMRDLHVMGSPVRTCLEYWQDTHTQRDIQLQWQPKQLLGVSSLDFIHHSLELLDNVKVSDLTLKQLDRWSQIKNLSKATGQRQVLMDSLTIKTFECEISTGKSWVPGLLVSTIDENIIFLTEFFERKHAGQSVNPQLNEDAVPHASNTTHVTHVGINHYHVVRKVSIKNLLNTIKDEYMVNVNERVKGMLFDSWVKEQVRFKTADSACEFMYFTENKLEVKKQYVI